MASLRSLTPTEQVAVVSRLGFSRMQACLVSSLLLLPIVIYSTVITLEIAGTELVKGIV